jgi:hypothetical protein
MRSKQEISRLKMFYFLKSHYGRHYLQQAATQELLARMARSGDIEMNWEKI